MKSLISILIAFSAQAGALPLAEFPQPPKDLLNPIEQQPIACDQLVNQLNQFRDRNRQHEDSIAAFLGEVAQKVTSWYEVLVPLEGQRNTLETGTFDPLKDGAEKTSRIVDYAYDNTAMLSADLDRIIVSIRNCNVTNK